MSREFTDIHALIGAVAKDYQYKKTIALVEYLSKLWEQTWHFFTHVLSLLFAKIGELFSQLGKSLSGAGISGKWVIIFFAVLLCVLLALILWRQRHWLKNFSSNGRGITGDGTNGQPRTSLEWQRQALAYKEQGHFDEACRALHRACLQSLDEAHLIIFAPARSNYEYTLALSRLPAAVNMQIRQSLRQSFQEFSNTVDGIYFGNRLADEAEYQFCLQHLQTIERSLAKIEKAQ